MAQDPKGPGQPVGSGSNVNFTNKLHAASDSKDANRDQNFDGTKQAGKDTFQTPKKQVPTDSAAESSQLTVNEMQGQRAMGPSGVPQVNTVPGNVTVQEGHPNKQETKYYRSSYPTFTFRYGRGQKASFQNYWLVTNHADVQFYIEHQLMHTPNGLIQIQEASKEQYDNDRRIPMQQPVIEPLPNQAELDTRTVRNVALHAKAPRTAANPDLTEPETGNAQQDHMTNFQRVQTDNLDKPIVDDRVLKQAENVIGQMERERSGKEQAAVGGATPATDTRANQPPPQRTGMTGSVPVTGQENKPKEG